MDIFLSQLRAFGQQAAYKYPLGLNLGESPSLFLAPDVPASGDELSVLMGFFGGDSTDAQIYVQARYELDGSAHYSAHARIGRKPTEQEWAAGTRGVSEGERLYDGDDLAAAVNAANARYAALLAEGYSADGGMCAAVGEQFDDGSDSFRFDLAECENKRGSELSRWKSALR